jgi:D-sedoheptulose 7-phosphate isomerase
MTVETGNIERLAVAEQPRESAAGLLAEIRDSFCGITALAGEVERASALIVAALRAGGRIFFCGNGGSAADAQHLAAEFLGRFQLERRALPAMALTANSSAVTAIGNDYGFEHIFARQIRGLARAGDVVVGISTSGRSANVVAAFHAAGEIGAVRIAFTGEAPSPMSELAELTLACPARHTARIQEMHIALGHAICERVEMAMA